MSAVAIIPATVPIQNPADAGISQMNESELLWELAELERPYPHRDQVCMSKSFSEPKFRRYIAVCRAWRAARKKG